MEENVKVTKSKRTSLPPTSMVHLEEGKPAHVVPVNPNSPDNLIRIALEASRPMEEIQKLIEMRNAEIARVAKLDFFEAKREFQRNCKDIIKNAEVDYKGKDGKPNTNYWYTDLDGILRVVREPAADAGLSYDWDTKEGRDGNGNIEITVTCILSHTSGHSKETSLSGPPDISGNKNVIQAKVSTITYLKRLTLSDLLGISTGARDDDGQGGAKFTPDAQPDRPVMTDQQFKNAMSMIQSGQQKVDWFKENMRISDTQESALRKFEAKND